MATTSKSPIAVLNAAWRVAQDALPAYSHRCSPKKFTQHQLFACLVLKKFLKTDYRGVEACLRDSSDLRSAIELEKVPHYTTLQKAADRLLLKPLARRLLDATVCSHLGRRRRVPLAAIDSTGLECTSASAYFVRRRAAVSSPWKTVVYHRFPKLSVICNVDTHFILAFETSRGPHPDVADFRPLLDDARRRVGMTSILADAGYDSEANHRHAREACGVRTVIPAKHGRPTDKPARGRYRRLMQVRFQRDAYRRRSQVETVMSMIKRRQGAHVPARSVRRQHRELRLMALAHNIMILLTRRVFDRACLTPFSPRGG
ncbi:Transposase DDE domain protein [Posidoniimonas polymericola]|uniref:Transposase DDE domain protein n=1 Tax=Posidoniimonas polymericola TaxID=2528002 RepID=A0A5C5YCR6_9BACT|nr:IS5 family transposase [Posidoniimonas polymericola]TWT73507.1 Transposase DDE domain protein [Posidoniimonas polymericola]